uniref:Purine nucleoside phosphorylase n=1 Tax=Caligus clemensi TaxID=344056 RepID=C1C0Q7_CALCM|nr:Purine nucleoside phosphorylase [Caligus clemensi]
MKQNSEKSSSYAISYEVVKESADYILGQISNKPTIGIICGSGLGSIGDAVKDPVIIKYTDIPHFPTTTVGSHRSQMVFGTLGGAQVMVMQGRFHFYEGHSIHTCSMPVRVMHLVGVKTLISTNASGGTREDLKVGDLLIMTDHINLLGFNGGQNPLGGANHDNRFGTRFVAMNKCYDEEYIKLARQIAKDSGLESIVKSGVYAMTGGPSYETPAEVRSMKILGGDCIGMSTVHENIVARQCGMRVFSMSLITNICVSSQESEDKATHQEVIEVGQSREESLKIFTFSFLAGMKKSHNTQ